MNEDVEQLREAFETALPGSQPFSDLANLAEACVKASEGKRKVLAYVLHTTLFQISKRLVREDCQIRRSGPIRLDWPPTNIRSYQSTT